MCIILYVPAKFKAPKPSQIASEICQPEGVNAIRQRKVKVVEVGCKIILKVNEEPFASKVANT